MKVLLDGEIRIGEALMRYETDAVADALAELGERLSVVKELTGGRLQKGRRDGKKGRLSRAVASEEDVASIRLERDIDLSQCGAAAEALREPPDFEGRKIRAQINLSERKEETGLREGRRRGRLP
jgi:hypothetical protein